MWMIVKPWWSILLNVYVYCCFSFRQQGSIRVFQIALLPLNFNTGLGLSSHRSYEGHICKMSRQQKFHFMVNVILLCHVLRSGLCIPLHQEMMVWCFVFFSVCLLICLLITSFTFSRASLQSINTSALQVCVYLLIRVKLLVKFHL